MGSQTPAPWELPGAKSPDRAGPTLPPAAMSAPSGSVRPNSDAPNSHPISPTVPPSAGLAPPQAIGAKTLGAWIGGAAIVGLAVSVIGGLILLPEDEETARTPGAGRPTPAASADSAKSSP